MKRNVISLLLALVMVFAITVALAPTAEAATTHDHTGWNEFTDNKTTISASGNWYLSAQKQAVILSGGTQDVPVNVTLCLNGNNLQSQVPVVLGEYCHLTICDCSDGEKGLIRYAQAKSNSYDPVVTIPANAILTLESGTITGVGSTSGRRATAVLVDGGTFNITGGTVIGEDLVTSSSTNDDTKRGPAIRLLSGSVNMSGGTIQAGNTSTTAAGSAVYMTDGIFTMSNGTIQDNAAANASPTVYMTGGEFEMSGGSITGSTAENTAAMVRMTGGEFNMSGGAISGAKNNNAHGGNIYITGDGEFNLSGTGTISGGQATASGQHGGNVAINSSSAVFTMSGGTISGGTAAAKGGNVCVVSGSFEMTGGTITGGTAGTYGGNVSVNTSGTFLMNGADAIISYGVATSGGGNLHRQASSDQAATLTAGTITKGGIALGTDGTTETVTNTVGGNIYLEKGKVVLNGATVSYGQTTEKGGNVYVAAGTLELSGGSVTNGTSADAGNIYVADGEVNQTNGNVSDGTATNTESGHGGGNVYVAGGTYNLTGGYIGQEATRQSTDENNAYYGGNVFIAGGIFNMGTEGSEETTRLMKNGKANQGGNVWIEGTDAVFNMYSGEMYRGFANNAGNIRVNKGTLNVHGGHINNGYTTGNGGNLSVANSSSTINISGGKISNGRAASGKQGGDIFFASGATVTVTGGEIGPANTNGCGKSIEWYGTTGTLAVGGTAVIHEVCLTGTKKITLADTALASGASIGINAAENYEFLETTDTTVKQYFVSYNGSMSVAQSATGLYLISGHVHCWCVGAETAPEGHANCANTVTWVGHDELTFNASNQLELVEANPYVYLSDNVTGSLNFTNAGSTTEFFLCLNGFRLRGSAPVSVPAGITLTVCDCGTTGRVMSSNSEQSANIVTVKGTLRWVSGTLQGLDEVNEKTNRCLIVNEGATAELYGGVIENGSRGNLQGGNVLVQSGGTFKLVDGVVRNGAAGTGNGGNISVAGGGSLQITGGEITGGTAKNGHNIAVEGTATIKDATVSVADSTTTSVYNIYMSGDSAALTLNGATVTGAYEAVRWYKGTSLTLDGAVTISSTGRELYLAKDKNVTLGDNLTNAGGNLIRATKVNLADSWDGSAVTFATNAKAEHEDMFVGGSNGSSAIQFNESTNELEFVASVAEIEGDVVGYATLAEALAKNPTTAIKLNKEITETGLTLTSNVYIDLKGFNLASIADAGYTLNIYDSTNKLYTGTPGKYAGTNAEEFIEVGTDVSGATTLRKYLNIDNGDNTVSPHRVYLSVTAVSANAGKMMLNYKAMFIGDVAVKAYVEQEGYYYGLKFQVGDNQAVYSYFNNGFTAYSDQDETKYTQKLAGVSGVEESNAEYGVTATAFIARGTNPDTTKQIVTVADGDVIATSATTDAYSFKGLIVSADAATNLSDNAKAALYEMYTKEGNEYMANWGLNNIPTKWNTITEE